MLDRDRESKNITLLAEPACSCSAAGNKLPKPNVFSRLTHAEKALRWWASIGVLN
jgi:hypothetical protein